MDQNNGPCYNTLEDVLAFYDSKVVIDTFNAGFAGRWHTTVVPEGDGPKSSEEYVTALLGLRPEHRALDFGSGVGVVACSIARRIGCHIRGLNISVNQVKIARLLASRAGVEDLAEFDLYGGREFPYATESFDRIAFFESPCHVRDKNLLVQEMFRVLKPGGICAGQDWFLTGRSCSKDDYDDWVLPIEVSCCVSLGSLLDYKELFENAGFVNLRVIDARDLYAAFASSFTRPSGEPVRVKSDDSMPDRLAKGNVALSNAFHRGLFTVGFIRGEKPPPRTIVQSRVRTDGRDLQTGTIDIYSKTKNLAAVDYHIHSFQVQESPVLARFIDVIRSSDNATVETSCKFERGLRHSGRFNLFFHDDVERSFSAVAAYFGRLARDLDLALDLRPIDEFMGDGFDFSRVTKVITGLDLRADPAGSRLKLWFMLDRYPEKVEHALRLFGGDPRVRALGLGEVFLVGFDLHLDGRTHMKLYPDLTPENNTHLRTIFAPDVCEVIAECRRLHVYFARPGRPLTLQFHPRDPDSFIDRYFDMELAAPVHDRYRGEHLLDMVVSCREADIGPEPIRDFALYYMPAEEIRRVFRL